MWFLDADEDIMESIVDEFNEIGIWYLYECGIDVPDMSVLVGRCPVQFDESDDSKTIGEKITSFFLNQQHRL